MPRGGIRLRGEGVGRRIDGLQAHPTEVGSSDAAHSAMVMQICCNCNWSGEFLLETKQVYCLLRVLL